MTKSQLRAFLVATALLALAGLRTLAGFISPVLWAAVFAIGLWPIYSKLARRWPGLGREVLPAIMVVAVLLVFVIPITMIAVPAAEDAHSASQWVGDVRAHGIAAPPFLAGLPAGDRLVALWHDRLGQPQAISGFTTHAMQGGLVQFGRKLGREALHRLVTFGFMLLALFFLLKDGEKLVEQLNVGARRAFGPAGEDIGAQVFRSVQGTVNGLVLVGLGEGLILGVTFWLCGVPRPTLFGVLSALLAMVPFGAGIAIAGAALVLLALNKLVAAAIAAAVGLTVTFVADHFVRPVLIGGATKLPFLLVLFGILGGVEAFGLVGLFIGPAILAALALLWREWVGSHRGPINPLPVEVPNEREADEPVPLSGGSDAPAEEVNLAR